jgi:hypothetical protein
MVDEERKKRVRRVRKSADSSTPVPEVSIPEVPKEESPQPIVEKIPAKKEVPVEERGRIVIHDNVLMDIVEKIVDKGRAVVISKGSGKDWLIHAEDESEFAIGRASTLDEYNNEVMTSAYLEWFGKWDKMSMEEKAQFAEESKAEWEAHPEPRINSMRMAQAVREVSEIVKYKEEYSSRSSRNRVRPRR